MTNEEAFKEAVKIIEKQKQHNWWEEKPVEAFKTPMRVIWIWLRMCDYYIINDEFPKNYRNLQKWEKKYYEEK